MDDVVEPDVGKRFDFNEYLRCEREVSRRRGFEVIREYCLIQSLVYHSMGDYTYASDGFCAECPFGFDKDFESFRHDGKTIEYIRKAVVDALKRDGVKIAEPFDPETGVYLKPKE